MSKKGVGIREFSERHLTLDDGGEILRRKIYQRRIGGETT